MNIIKQQLAKVTLPNDHSHKGQNGKLLIIGGSDLFHAASRWSLDIASKFVDMVFYSSVPSNNELIQQVKGEFWNGIVVRREDIESYIQEADCILIGPGMTRKDVLASASVSALTSESEQESTIHRWEREPTLEEWNNDTEKVVNYLLAKYPDKKWVVDAGALQMVDPRLLNANCIVTPHKKEFIDFTAKLSQHFFKARYKKEAATTELLTSPTEKQAVTFDYVKSGPYSKSYLSEKGATENILLNLWSDPIQSYQRYRGSNDAHERSSFHDLNWDLYNISLAAQNATFLLKGELDLVIYPGDECKIFSGDESFINCIIPIEGGNAGMTKGGTGDVLAGLVAALYCTHDAITAAVVGSYINKKAGDDLYKTVGPYFNSSDLVEQIPKTLWNELV